jgi:hypothetical protein
MSTAYTCNASLSLGNDPPGRIMEVRNPASSGFLVEIQMLATQSEADSATWRIERFTSLAVHGTPLQVTVYKSDPSAAAFAGEIWTGDIDWTGMTMDFEYDFALDPKGAGDDAQWHPNIYQGIPIVIPEGCSVAITPPTGQADYRVQIHCTQTAV